jgi:hypothetical protein
LKSKRIALTKAVEEAERADAQREIDLMEQMARRIGAELEALKVEADAPERITPLHEPYAIKVK